MILKKAIFLFTASIFVIISFSCSLNYSKEGQNFEKRANFIFKNANLDQYENFSLNLRVNFEELEVYDEDRIWAGKNLQFSKIDKNSSHISNSKPELKGSAGLVQIDEKNGKYFLGKNVFFEDLKEDLIISGDSFFWNKTENILHGREKGIVSLKKGEELYIEGEGFIANTLSKEFEFLGFVKGNIKTDNKE